MKYVSLICPVCGKSYEKSLGHYNRAKKLGFNVFCSLQCAGISKRTSIEEKKKVKADYDKKHRKEFAAEIKIAKAAAFKKDYAANPEKYKAERKRRYPQHLEYLRNPAYKEWKKEYDKKYRAEKDFGVFAEAAIILFELETFLQQNMPSELKFQMGITNKTQKRKRLWQRTAKNFQQQP